VSHYWHGWSAQAASNWLVPAAFLAPRTPWVESGCVSNSSRERRTCHSGWCARRRKSSGLEWAKWAGVSGLVWYNDVRHTNEHKKTHHVPDTETQVRSSHAGRCLEHEMSGQNNVRNIPIITNHTSKEGRAISSHNSIPDPGCCVVAVRPEDHLSSHIIPRKNDIPLYRIIDPLPSRRIQPKQACGSSWLNAAFPGQKMRY
jgi:hypothetical protein